MIAILIAIGGGLAIIFTNSAIGGVGERGFTITQNSEGHITIEWAITEGAAKYDVYHSGSLLGRKTLLGTTTSRMFVHKTPNPVKWENYYTIVPRNAAGEAIIGLTWNRIDAAVSFNIYRSDNGGEFVQIGSTPANNREFVDKVADFDFGMVEYRINPINANGNIIFSNFDPDSPAHTRDSPLLRGNSITRNIIIREHYPLVASFQRQLFGPNVFFFDAKYDEMEDIIRKFNRIGDAMRSHVNDVQMSESRFSFYFKPGEYNFPSGTRLDIGFYMTVAGLGITPTGTRIGATLYTPPALPHSNNNGDNGTHNFWRSIENFEVFTPEGATPVTLGWAVSQAAPARRISTTYNVTMNYNMNGGWVSGGFAADMRFGGRVIGGGQQQWYTRNSHYTVEKTGVAWNRFTIASTGQVTPSNFMDGRGTVTTVRSEGSPNAGIEQMREKPFLYYCTIDNTFRVFVPGIRYNALGISWTYDYPGIGRSICISEFYIAKSGMTAAHINEQLVAGKHLFYMPGFFECEVPVFVGNENTVVLGTGMPTLFPGQNNTEGAMLISDVSGVTVAGLFIDAHFSSKYLLRVGEPGSNRDHSHNPTFIFDVFARIGGFKPSPTHVEVCVDIHSNNVIGDHFWIWRANHGRAGSIPGLTGHQWRWRYQVAPFGLIVHGDDVTMHGLHVEHFLKYETLWLGERGRVYFYQNESPYEPYEQAVYGQYRNGEWVNGWASLKVANHVENFFAIGLGMYGVFNAAPIALDNAIEAPNRPNVRFEAMFANEIGSARGWTNHIINGTGGPARNAAGARVALFENGIATFSDGTTAIGVDIPDEDLDALIQGIFTHRSPFQ